MEIISTLKMLGELEELKEESINDLNKMSQTLIGKIIKEKQYAMDTIEKNHKNQKDLIEKNMKLGPNDVIVTNTHHFNEGVTLFITDKGWVWKHKDRILDPVSNKKDFVTLLDIVFRFIGTDFLYSGEYINQMKIKSGENKKDMTGLDVIRYIYSQPLEQDVKFVRIGSCGCNMGRCGAITSITIDDKNHETYEDLMRLFGYDIVINGETYYEYPDSVWFSILEIGRLPTTIFDGNCRGGKIPVAETLDPKTTYVEWGFNR